MIGVGLDYGPGLLQVAIDEGHAPQRLTDGHGAVMPHAADPSLAPVAIWSRLLGRLAGHLGVEPGAAPAATLAVADAALPVATMVQAGWRPPRIVLPTEALVAAAMALDGDPVERWVAVVAGETVAEAQAFVIDRPSRAASALGLHRVEDVGYFDIARHVCRLAGLKGAMDRRWFDAAWDLAEELAQAGDHAVRWRGLSGPERHSPIVRVHEVLEWPAVQRTEQALASLARLAADEVRGSCRVIVGGIAAAWPVGRHLVAAVAPGGPFARAGLVAAGAARIGRDPIAFGRAGAPPPSPSVQPTAASADAAIAPWRRASDMGAPPPWKR